MYIYVYMYIHIYIHLYLYIYIYMLFLFIGTWSSREKHRRQNTYEPLKPLLGDLPHRNGRQGHAGSHGRLRTGGGFGGSRLGGSGFFGDSRRVVNNINKSNKHNNNNSGSQNDTDSNICIEFEEGEAWQMNQVRFVVLGVAHSGYFRDPKDHINVRI